VFRGFERDLAGFGKRDLRTGTTSLMAHRCNSRQWGARSLLHIWCILCFVLTASADSVERPCTIHNGDLYYDLSPLTAP
jgi:hypothetical protein